VDCNAQFQGLSRHPNLRPEIHDVHGGADPGAHPRCQRHARLLEHQDQEPDHRGRLSGRPEQSLGVSDIHDHSRQDNLPGIPNSGTLVYVSTPWANANSVKTDGIDLDIIWRQRATEWGRQRRNFNGRMYSTSSRRSPMARPSASRERRATMVYSAAGTPSDRMNLIVGWNQPNLTGTVRYVSDCRSIAFKGSEDGCLSLSTSRQSATCPRSPPSTCPRRTPAEGSGVRLDHQRLQPDRTVQPLGCVRNATSTTTMRFQEPAAPSSTWVCGTRSSSLGCWQSSKLDLPPTIARPSQLNARLRPSRQTGLHDAICRHVAWSLSLDSFLLVCNHAAASFSCGDGNRADYFRSRSDLQR
jgi:hypothetical protein